MAVTKTHPIKSTLRLFAVQTDEPHAELHAALYPRGRIKPVGFETASAFPVLFTAV